MGTAHRNVRRALLQPPVRAAALWATLLLTSACASSGLPCTTAADCLTGEVCLASHCAAVPPSGSATLGEECQVKADCASTLGCLTQAASGFPGGVCSINCTAGQCPAGATCADLSGSAAGVRACLEQCSADAQCRTGYVCCAGLGGACAPQSACSTTNPAPAFLLSAGPNSLSLASAASGAVQVSLSSSGGFNAAVALSVAGMPAGVTATFSAASVPGGSGSSTLTVNAGTAPAGSATLTLTATGGGLTRTATIALTLTGPSTSTCTPDTWAGWSKGFFSAHCTGCHSWASSYSSVKNKQSTCASYIQSGQMPQGETLSAADKTRVLKWLNCGSPQ
jgi:hypothetical protein